MNQTGLDLRRRFDKQCRLVFSTLSKKERDERGVGIRLIPFIPGTVFMTPPRPWNDEMNHPERPHTWDSSSSTRTAIVRLDNLVDQAISSLVARGFLRRVRSSLRLA